MMTRTARLLTLMQLLRTHKTPLTADMLAEQLAVSVRTIYRDMDTLRAQGAVIHGEAGLGFVLVQDSSLPPLIFDVSEVSALLFGMRLASTQGDRVLSTGAKSALAKLYTILPEHLKRQADAQALYPAYSRHYSDDEQNTLVLLRHALATGVSVHFDYLSLADERTERTIHPVAVGYFQNCCLLAGFCLLRQDFRNFRIDRIGHMRLDAPCPVPHDWLLKRWQAHENCIDFSPFDMSLNTPDSP